MELLERAEIYAGDLTDADHRLLAVLLGDRAESSYLSAKAVAGRAGVHESTAGRLATKLGFSSYRDMRGSLRGQVISELDSAVRMASRLDRIGGGSALEAIVASEVKVLTDIPRQVSGDQITAAADLLARARRIVLFGISHAGWLASLMARRLVRSGYDALAIQNVDWSAADALMGMGRDDVLLAFEFRRATEGLKKLATTVASLGGHVILISDGVARLAEPRPAVTLAASRGGKGDSQSLVVPMIIANTLVLELSRIDEGRSLNALGRLGELRDALQVNPQGGTARTVRRPAGAGTRQTNTEKEE
jgi:DNA-binding MurR/RpiR family transcriptional regulator